MSALLVRTNEMKETGKSGYKTKIAGPALASQQKINDLRMTIDDLKAWRIAK